MNNNFKEIIIKDNFYQSSSFFPMPLTLIGTLNEDASLTSYGAYSLIFPYYIAGKGYYAMVLECRNTSNTAKGLLRHGKCTINFLPYSKKNFAQHVDCGFPGDTPEEKMKEFRFTPIDGQSQQEHPNEKYPKILKEALQVFECSWVKELDNAQDDKVLEEYEVFKSLRTDVLKGLEDARANKVIGSAQEAFVAVKFNDNNSPEAKLFAELDPKHAASLFVVSEIRALDNSGNDYELAKIEVKHHTGHFCERCWNYEDDAEVQEDGTYLCKRCAKVVK